MVNDLTSKQIVELAAQGTPPAEIASVLSIEPAFVNLVLAAQGNTSAERDIDDQQLEVLRRHAFRLATQTDHLPVAAKMTRFLIERDKPRAATPTTSPIANINQAIILAQGKFHESIKSYFGKEETTKVAMGEETNIAKSNGHIE